MQRIQQQGRPGSAGRVQQVVQLALVAALVAHCVAAAPEVRIELDGDTAAIAFGAPPVHLQRTAEGNLSVDAALHASALSAGSVGLTEVTFGENLPSGDYSLETVIGDLMQRIKTLESASAPKIYSSCSETTEPGFHYIFKPGFTALRQLWCDEDGYTLVATIGAESSSHSDRGLVVNNEAPGFLSPGSAVAEKLPDAEITELANMSDGGIYRLVCGDTTAYFDGITFDAKSSQYCSAAHTWGQPGDMCYSGRCAAGYTGVSNDGGATANWIAYYSGGAGCTKAGEPGFSGELWVKESSPPTDACL